MWNDFNVTWAPATRVNINDSRVYYDVSLHFHGQYKIEVSIHFGTKRMLGYKQGYNR